VPLDIQDDTRHPPIRMTVIILIRFVNTL